MQDISSKFHFPLNIQLASSPLAEAWLDIRWELETGSSPNIARDPRFPFALGKFYDSVKERFGYQRSLDANRAPIDMLPHVVRYQFRPSEEGWPLLQLGPGVASVNFTDPYTWEDFKDAALYLRSKLVEAYGVPEPNIEKVILKYRNVEPFDYNSENLLGFLRNNLNTSLSIPSHIPGETSSTNLPKRANIELAFDLVGPKGVGILQVSTGTKRQEKSGVEQLAEQEVVIWHLTVMSEGGSAPQISDEEQFSSWLDSAHSVTHEWFFALIEGSLFKKYKG